MNADGIALLGALIDRSAGLTPLVENGDCQSIATEVNFWMPPELKVSAADVFAAIKTREDFGGPKLNVEILRARIDAMAVLTSARLSGDYQAILNELNFDPDIAGQATIEDVKAAMELRRVAKPSRVSQGSAAMVGISQL